jgi:hypothetical protein
LPQAGAIVGTLPFAARETELLAAHARTLFVVVVPPGRAASITVERVDRDGAVTRKRVRFDPADYLMDVSTGRDGIYAGTVSGDRGPHHARKPIAVCTERTALAPSPTAAVTRFRELGSAD